MNTPLRIFMSYAREDLAQVSRIYRRLQRAGHQPWMDKHNLIGGEKWEPAIYRALSAADFVFIFLSAHSTTKRGFLQREIRKALYIAEEKLDTDIYIIPVRLEPCITDPALGVYQRVDIFEPNGWAKLLQAIKEGAERRKSKETSEAL